MPTKYVKKTKKMRKPKYVKKTNKVVTYNRNSAKLGLGFPKRLTMAHRYFEIVNVTCTSGLLGNYLFSCNNLYDPNYTGTGHQPMLYDQMIALYNHWVVIGAKIKVKVSHSGNTNYAANCGVYINDDTTVTPGSLASMVEQGQCSSYKMIPPQSNETFTFNCKWSPKKVFGGSILGNPNLQGAAATGPAESSYFNIFVQPVDGISTQSYIVEAEISYIVVWTELKDITGS